MCEGHAAHVDLTLAFVAGGTVRGTDLRTPSRGDMGGVLVTGPTSDGNVVLSIRCGTRDIQYEAEAEVALPRFVAEDLVHEIQRRLSERD